MFRVFSPSSVFRIFVVLCFLALGLTSTATAVTETVLHQFVSQSRGAFPESLAADAQGNMYGMTQDGGMYGYGSVFKLSKNSSGKWNQTVLHSFTGLTDGNNYFPYTNENSLIFDKAGNLYGSTPEGGLGSGVIFKLSPGSNGNWNYTVLYSFKGGKTDGYTPTGPLAFDAQGDLYGTTTFGGNQSTNSCQASCGIVFRLTPSASGWTEKVVHFFTEVNEGANPTNGVVFDSNGNMFGTTSTFSDIASTVFEITRTGGNWTLTTLHSFSASGDASNPEGVILDASGNLYGASYQGGVNGDGAVFELAHSSSGWTESVLYSFNTGASGFSPTGNVTFDGSGNLIGVTGSGGSGSGGGNGVVYKLTLSSGAWTESVLYTFNGGTDGVRPVSNVILDSAGDVFGVTSQGASANYGTVYELVPSAGTYAETQLFAFPATDGANVVGGLVADSAGNLYGTAVLGGLNLCPNGGYFGCGSVYKLSRSSDGAWVSTTLHNFTGPQGGDGGSPASTLTFDSAGNLYGTTAGGIGSAGTAFKLSPSGSGWTFRTLYTFGSHRYDGFAPQGKLIFDKSGNIYGTTFQGGNGSYLNCNVCGTVFKLAPTASGRYTESIIYNFQGLSDGSAPAAGLVLDAAGNLYGTAAQGGIAEADNGCGVAYRLSPNSDGSWTQAVLYTFTCGADGGGPEGALVLDAAGNLYGTTPIGGTGACGGCGVVFELTPSSTVPWNETVIYDFPATSTGAYPESTLTFDKAGNLYGTTNGGGDAPNQFCTQGCGTVFELTPSSSGWQETTLYNFAGPLTDGASPTAGVILDSAGNIYGTTKVGGINGYDYQYGGTVYRITR
jgi:hypothetical protein